MQQEHLTDKEIALAIKEDRRLTGRAVVQPGPVLAACLVLCLSILGFTAQTTVAQGLCSQCQTTLTTDCLGNPSPVPIVITGGDVAGRVNPVTGAIEPDGFINQFDVVRLVDLYYKGQYNPCVDLDQSGTLTLGPTTIGGINYCGDLPLMQLVFGACQASCRTLPNGDPAGANPCDTAATTPGCSDTNCCALVCLIDDLCCETNGTGWDQNCVALQDQLCTQTGGDCLVASSNPGCLSSACQAAVCQQDPLCCLTAWDQNCVDLAGLLCLDILCEENAINPANCAVDKCGESGLGSCTIAHFGGGCSDPACCAIVCQADPACCDVGWDASCAQSATLTCSSVAAYCGNTSPNDNCFTPGVSLDVFAPARGCQDFDCCNTVCQFDPYCCLVTWDQNCADDALDACARYNNCGAIGTGDCIQELEDGEEPPAIGSGCNDINCCNNVCAVLPNCCEIEWDQSCREKAEELCTNCGDTNAGGCFDTTNNSPGCNNAECCLRVCLIDQFCCDDELGVWDQQCVLYAEATCDPATAVCGKTNTRGCFVPNTAAGCRETPCCEEVCETFDPYCCEISWDAICAATALSIDSCLAANNFDAFGPCLEPHGGKGCNVPACAAAVCALPGQFAFECCEVQWDQNCADLAAQLCYDLLVCPSDASCTTAHPGVGCEDPFCCNAVCELEPTCCTNGWDDLCVTLAVQYCDSASLPYCPCEGSCFEPRFIDIDDPDRPQPGCEDASCCAAVCELQPSCCETLWDASCVTLAEQYCCKGGLCGDSCAGSCLEVSDTPNCSDPACCAAVCALRPYCCESRWDSGCVQLAAERCLSGCGIPTSGSCFIGKAGTGCEDPECCADVCEDDPYCCQVSWDTACAQMAQESTQCDPPVCGGFETGNCCEINGSPACNDDSCCTAVCLLDEFCCEGAWDDLCVSLARESTACDGLSGCTTGASNCGDFCAGDCCTANGSPLCNDQVCCAAVCALDNYCCDNEWDVYCAQQARTTCNYNDENSNTNPALDACPQPKCGQPGTGSCCLPNGTALCDDEECCKAVGLIDPYCTSVAWDQACVTIAVTNGACDCAGGTQCGDPAAGDCCEARDTPYCDNGACCTTVCTIDPTCCEIFWSQDCVIWAEFYCSDICDGNGDAPLLSPWEPLPSSAFPSTKPKPVPPKAKSNGGTKQAVKSSAPLTKKPVTK